MGGLSKLEGAADLVGRLAGQAPEQKLLTYNPGPGIYSRLERAVEAMPENVRVQELPGLLKRYKEGVPGWELKAVDLDSVVGGRDVVPRQEILDAVRQRSPVHTHKEVVLGGRPTRSWSGHPVFDQDGPSPLGRGVSHGKPKYESHGQGGTDYTELLLNQPGAVGSNFGSHWSGAGGGHGTEAVAHARFDTHGDALRINELQSDLGIHNRKARERAGQPQGPAGWDNTATPTVAQELPFPLEDAWADILIKRLALEAARGGHRAIEIASPRAIADKVGGTIENYEHAYGKVARGTLERLGRKMGGMTDATPSQQELLPGYSALAEEAMLYNEPYAQGLRLLDELRPAGAQRRVGRGPETAFRMLTDQDTPYGRGEKASLLHGALAVDLQRGGMSAEEAYVAAAQHMPTLMRTAEDQAEAYERFASLRDLGFMQDSRRKHSAAQASAPGFRGIMSDEMRRRIILEGIPASVAGAIGTDQILDRLDKDSPQPQLR